MMGIKFEFLKADNGDSIYINTGKTSILNLLLKKYGLILYLLMIVKLVN